VLIFFKYPSFLRNKKFKKNKINHCKDFGIGQDLTEFYKNTHA
jgi:hypothetical protein